MKANRIGAQIEELIGASDWKSAQGLIEKQLDRKPDDHWLWARLSGVRYELQDYQGALEAAEKSLDIVPDCPLALWSKAGALEALSRVADAMGLYSQLFRRGLAELRNPDADANECWEGPDWTSGLLADCLFRIAGCLAKTGQRVAAVEMYQRFLSLGDLGTQGIYSHQDALERLKKLVPSKKARRAAMAKMMEIEKELISA